MRPTDRNKWVDQLLFAHPREAGETYREHAAIAGRFGLALMLGGAQCLIHALLPGVYGRAASDTVGRLHSQLTRRRAASDCDPDYII